jgi:hypothetical protein
MSVVTLQIAKPWQVRLPVLIRYMEKNGLTIFSNVGN